MAEVMLGEDMGEVVELNNPPGTSWLRFSWVLPDQNVPIVTGELSQLKGTEPQRGDFYIAEVNYIAQELSELGIKLLRFVSKTGDI